MASSSSSSLNWVYDVFVSFRGEDVRVNFLSHFLKELDRKLIKAFKDYEIEKSHSLSPELEKAIRSSRIAVVVFSKNYTSSSWCLNELLEIVNRDDKIIIPVFYGLDPSHVRKQTGDFGEIFEETCKKNNTEEVKDQWKKALTDVANMVGFDSANWDNEAKLIEEIANDVLRKLLSTSSEGFENFVGIEDHMAKMSELLQLESEEVRMVGIWGSSGIGKTIIARALFNQLPQHFQVSKYIDRAFVSQTKEIYSRANPDDHNMKLNLQQNFLSEIVGVKDIKINHLGSLGERLHHHKVLIIIDDLDDQVVLDSLVGQTHWFGSGSRIIVVTNDKHFLRAHSIGHIYEVSLPTEERALEMLCQSAFKQNSPRKGFEKLAVEVVRHVGTLPLALNVLGSSLRERETKYWMELLQDGLDNKIGNVLRVSYDGLGREKDKAIFRHIACFFNHEAVTYMEMLLADSNLGVNIALQNLADKSLIQLREGHIEMHSLLEKMGREIVSTQSIDEPGKREFLVEQEDICHVLNEGTGTGKVLGISLDTNEIDELYVHERAFKGMCNLRFLKIYAKIYKLEEEVRLHLPESFDYWPPKLKLLSWRRYPMSCMPSGFRLDSLVQLEMQESKLDKLWEGVVSLPCLKKMDLWKSHNLKEIPDLSMAINLEKLNLGYCSSLVELPSSIRNLNKLLELDMFYCNSLETLSTGFNLKSLDYLRFEGCRKLRTFPKFSTNISSLFLEKTNIEEFPSDLCLENLDTISISKFDRGGKQWEAVKPLTPFLAMLSPTLTKLWLTDMPNLVELPSSFQNLNQLKKLWIKNCRNLETLPTGINLKYLDDLYLSGCSRLRSFPEISTKISRLNLEETGIEEVPWQIENFSNLSFLYMRGCSKLKCVSLHVSKLKHLKNVDFSECGSLTRVDLSGNSSEVEMETVPEEASSSLSDGYLSIPRLDFSDCFKLDREALLEQQSIIFDYVKLPGEEVPSYFTHCTTEDSLTNIPLLESSPSQPFFRFWVCAVVNAPDGVDIDVKCQFKDKYGNSFDSIVQLCSALVTRKGSHQLLIFDCGINLNKDNAYLPQLKYDHVDMKIHVSAGPPGWKIMFSIREWGIRLLEDCSSPENRLCSRKTFPRNENDLLLRELTDFMLWSMSAEEVALYYTHRTNGTSLTNIPLPPTSLSQPFFRFKAFVRVDCKSSLQFSYLDIHFSCQFRGRFGNHFESPYRPYKSYKFWNGISSVVLECLFPLNQVNDSLAQMNYDHVDIHCRLTSRGDSTARLQRWGIHFFQDCSSPKNLIGDSNTLQPVCEADADNTVSDEYMRLNTVIKAVRSISLKIVETVRSISLKIVETVRSISLTSVGTGGIDQFEDCGDSEIDQFEDCETDF